MKGKAKLQRECDGLYHVYVKNYFWQRYKPLILNGKQITFKDFAEFGKITQIEAFDEICITYDKYSGMVEK